MSTDKEQRELIEAAAVCAGDRYVSRRLAAAICAVYPDLAHDAESARRTGECAQRIVVGGVPQPESRTAADRVWRALDDRLGGEITGACIARRSEIG